MTRERALLSYKPDLEIFKEIRVSSIDRKVSPGWRICRVSIKGNLSMIRNGTFLCYKPALEVIKEIRQEFPVFY